MIDLSHELTVFVLTIGDKVNYEDCLAHLDAQTVSFRKDTIKDVAPMSAALQRMIDRCSTSYFLQVDEDMLLYPHAIQTLHRALVDAPHDIALFCAGLWDSFLEMPIHGVKIYRHEIMKKFPYENTFSCEWTQIIKFREAGYNFLQTPLIDESSCLGEHGKHHTPRTIFMRFQRLAQKHRRYKHMQWLELWPGRLLERICENHGVLNLYALLGLIAGMTGELPPNIEVDYRDACDDFLRLQLLFEKAAK